MLPDFEMIVHHFDREDINIYPIFDVHFGAQEHLTREWEKFLLRVAQEKNAYLILGGDLIDNGTRNSITNVFHATHRPSEQKRIMAKMLEPVRDKILCSVSGNHERRSGKDADDDPTYDIMAKLDIESLYRENTVFMKLQFGNSRGNGDKNPAYVFAVTHGAGGGMLTGGAVNRSERWAFCLDGCDAIVTGHTHKPFLTQPSKIKIDPYNNRVTMRPFKVITATSWIDYTSYAAQKMLTPTSFAPQVIHLCGKHKRMSVEM